MATIQKRKNPDGTTTYRVLVRLKGHPVQTASFARKTDAGKWGAQTENAIREGRHFKTVEAKKHTLAELIDRYLREQKQFKSNLERDQKRHFIWWKEQIGSYLLSDVTPSLIVECRNKLIEKKTYRGTLRSKPTANRYLAALSHAFTIAIKEWGWLEANPLRQVKRFSENKGLVRFLSEEERPRLLEACKSSSNPFLNLIVILALSTGARRNEILSLKWDQVDLDRKVIILLETKNGEIRRLPLVSHALELMKQHVKVRRIDTNLVFPGQNPQKPIEIRHAWETALVEAEIKDFRFHDLRHSAASYLAMNGATLAEIAEVLGHKTLQLVKRYSHLSQAHTTQVVASMNNKIFN